MGASVAIPPASAHQQRVQNTLRGDVADLKKLRKRSMWASDALDCAEAIRRAGLTQKEAAARLWLTESQLTAQLKAEERPQTELFRYDDVLSAYYLAAQAARRPDVCDVRMVITMRVPA